ncbi:unnamed protein product, partial [marine sediment metagenome]
LMELSIVIPALNEERKIGRDVEAAAAFLAAEGLSGEIIVVDDGSTDGTAAAAESAPVGAGIVRRVIRHERNHGKGCAVRTGMLETRGEYAMFADSGLCVPFSNALRGLALLRSGRCDLAHGSRHLPESVIVRRRGPYRRLISRLYRWAIPVLAHTPGGLSDPQCGFKMYRGDVARALYGRCVCDGFLFDVEIILRAARLGYRVEEFPIQWRSDPDSRLRPVRAIPRLLRELRMIRRALAGGRAGPP